MCTVYIMTSICIGKRPYNPNRCKKLRGCKVASGKKRTFCRKIKSKRKATKSGGKSQKSKKNRTQKKRTRKNKN